MQKSARFFVYVKKIIYLRTDFFVMSVDFIQLTSNLTVLVDQLKQRCLEAEAHVLELQHQLDVMRQTNEKLEAEKAEVETKYRNLKTGLSTADGDPAQIEQLREQYLAMVSEIDACIELLQHG